MSDCLSDSTVADLLEGRITDDERAALETHLDGCTACRKLLTATAQSLLDSLPPSPTDQRGPRRGTTIGRYVLLRTVGAGAMGVVYSAVDPDLDRKVAIKLLHTSADDDAQKSARLLREAQAIARVSHPNVVSVFDVGTFHGQVFFAMEYVEGGTLREWLAEKPRSVREILATFVQAGLGLAAAHDAGLVHRDFKPDNVLVGADGRVRVTDFGLVRETSFPGRAADASTPGRRPLTLTATGIVAGTPAYMSPEQMQDEPASPRSDQFSFCVALFEALYGVRPFPGDDFGALRASVMAGKLRSAPRQAWWSRRHVPARVHRALARGMRRRPEERFPTMQALLHPLRGDATRRQSTFALVAIGAVGLAAFATVRARDAVHACAGAERSLAGVWDAPRKAEAHRAFSATGAPYAEASWSAVEAALDGYAAAWVSMHEDACQATQVRHEQSSELLDLRMQCLARRLRDVRALTGLLARADVGLVEKSVEAAHALSPLDECANGELLRARVPPPSDPTTRSTVDGIEAELADIRAREEAGRYAEALALAHPLTERARTTRYPPVQAEALLIEGDLEDKTAAYAEAAESLRQAVWSGEAGKDDETVARAMITLVRVAGYRLARRDEASLWAQAAGARLSRVGDPGKLHEALSTSRGVVARAQGRYQEALVEFQHALDLHREARGADDPELAGELSNVGQAQRDLGRYDAALVNFQSALAIREHLLGPSHPDVATSHQALCFVGWKQGRYDDALSECRRALGIQEAIFGPDHVEAAYTLNLVGDVFFAQGHDEEALISFERVLAIGEKALGAVHPEVGMAHSNLGMVLSALKRYEEAGAEYEKALDILAHTQGLERPYAGMVFVNRGALLADQGRYREALANHERALAIFDKQVDPTFSDVAEALTGLGEDELGLKQPAAALTPLERALTLEAPDLGEPTQLADTRFALARALWDSGGDRARALELAQRAGEGYRGRPGRNQVKAALVETWLGAHKAALD